MAHCKYCDRQFQWGFAEGRWIPLVPMDEHEGLDRQFQDENGFLRADHRLVCTNRGGAAVRIARLAKTVPAGDIISWTKPDQDGVIEPVRSSNDGNVDHK